MLLKTKSLPRVASLCAGVILGLSNVAFAEQEPTLVERAEAVQENVAAAKPADQQRQPEVLIITNMGEFAVRLNPEKAPKTVENFLSYVDSGHYKDTIFHRVISTFMIQGGGFTADMTQKPVNAPIENEADNGLINEFGTIAMARTNDPHSATAQFFINTQYNQNLDHRNKSSRGWGYTVFGEVFCGSDVIQKIKRVPTASKNRFRDVPVEPVVIYDIKRI